MQRHILPLHFSYSGTSVLFRADIHILTSLACSGLFYKGVIIMKKKKYTVYIAAIAVLLLVFGAIVYASGDGTAASGGFWEEFKAKLILNFVKEDRWKYLTTGLMNTIIISFFALIIGLFLGFIIAILRSTFDMMPKKNLFCRVIDWILKAYLTVIRGTPSLIQLLIMYYVIFTMPNISKVFVAVLSFGLNSSAYIAEIVRSGITSVDSGQFEAGRSLGFTHAQTMIYFILPQAFKNILPALGNEFIVLVKETSIAGYIGINELTRGGDFIRSRTYEAFLPLIAVAIVYLIIVMLLTKLVDKMERRLKTDERN